MKGKHEDKVPLNHISKETEIMDLKNPKLGGGRV